MSYGATLAHGAHVHLEGAVVACHAYRGKGLAFCELEAAVEAVAAPAALQAEPPLSGDNHGSSSSHLSRLGAWPEPAADVAGFSSGESDAESPWVDRGSAGASTSGREQGFEGQPIQVHRVRGRLVVPEVHYMMNTAAKYKAAFPPGAPVVLRGKALLREGARYALTVTPGYCICMRLPFPQTPQPCLCNHLRARMSCSFHTIQPQLCKLLQEM